MRWGTRGDNFMSIYKKKRPFKVIRDKYRFFMCIGRLRVNIYNPSISRVEPPKDQ
ncbi:hypothetical protein [Vibrio phage LP.2]|nr:hypothetical protein [Vibrio phage LP.2]